MSDNSAAPKNKTTRTTGGSMGVSSPRPEPRDVSSGGVLEAILGPQDRGDGGDATAATGSVRRTQSVEAIYYDGTVSSGHDAMKWDKQLIFTPNYRPTARVPHLLMLHTRRHYLTTKGVLSNRVNASRDVKPNRWIVRDALGNLYVHTDQDFQALYPKV